MGTITGNLNIKAGSGSISIEHASLPNTTMKIEEISKFGVSYDLEDKSETADTVFFTPSKFEFSAFDGLGNGDSLFNAIDSIISTDEIAVHLNFSTNDGYAWNDSFVLYSHNIEFDRRNRITKMKSKLNATLSSATIRNIFDANPSFVYQVGDIDCMLIRDFVRSCLGTITQPIVALNTLGEGDLAGNLSWIVTADNSLITDGPQPDIPQITSAEKALYLIAALDGSMVGAIMGYSFMIGRTNKTNTASIAPKDVLDLKIKPTQENYLRIFVGGETLPNEVVAPYLFAGTKYGTADGLNDEAKKVLSVYFLIDFFIPAQYDTASSQFEDYGPDTAEITKKTETKSLVSEGSYGVPVKADPGLNPGDMMTFKDITINWSNADSDDFSVFYHPTKTYVVSDYRNGNLYFDSPLQEDIPNNTDVNEVGSTWTTAAEQAAESYALAYGAGGGKRIELTINDVDKVKPYEAITLTGGFGFGLNNKTFRPSEIKYDLHKDEIKIKAYEI